MAVQSWYEMGPCAEAALTGNTFLCCGLHDPTGRFTDCPADLSIRGAQTVTTDIPDSN